MRHLYITILLFGLLIFRPLLSETIASMVFLGVLTLTAWLLAVGGRKIMIAIATLTFLAIGLEVFQLRESLDAATPGWLPLTHATIALIVALLLYCAGSILVALLRAEQVGMDVVVASVNFYLIIGFIWAYLYHLMFHIRPAAFDIDASVESVPVKLIYFSFVTMTTLGYGDIFPRTPAAQMLASVEAIIGQLYVPVVVAYLLSLHTGKKLDSEEESNH